MWQVCGSHSREREMMLSSRSIHFLKTQMRLSHDAIFLSASVVSVLFNTVMSARQFA